jgi:hypothetical protein
MEVRKNVQANVLMRIGDYPYDDGYVFNASASTEYMHYHILVSLMKKHEPTRRIVPPISS